MPVEATFNPEQYARLLAESLPAVIETEAENERLLAVVDQLMRRGQLSPEQEKLLKLLAALIEDFEDRHYQLNAATPRDILLELMEARGVKPRDLWEVFGSKGTASEVISGKRGISKAQAKALGKFFNVSPELFI